MPPSYISLRGPSPLSCPSPAPLRVQHSPAIAQGPRDQGSSKRTRDSSPTCVHCSVRTFPLCVFRSRSRSAACRARTGLSPRSRRSPGSGTGAGAGGSQGTGGGWATWAEWGPGEGQGRGRGQMPGPGGPGYPGPGPGGAGSYGMHNGDARGPDWRTSHGSAGGMGAPPYSMNTVDPTPAAHGVWHAATRGRGWGRDGDGGRGSACRPPSLPPHLALCAPLLHPQPPCACGAPRGCRGRWEGLWGWKGQWGRGSGGGGAQQGQGQRGRGAAGRERRAAPGMGWTVGSPSPRRRRRRSRWGLCRRARGSARAPPRGASGSLLLGALAGQWGGAAGLGQGKGAGAGAGRGEGEGEGGQGGHVGYGASGPGAAGGGGQFMGFSGCLLPRPLPWPGRPLPGMPASEITPTHTHAHTYTLITRCIPCQSLPTALWSLAMQHPGFMGYVSSRKVSPGHGI